MLTETPLIPIHATATTYAPHSVKARLFPVHKRRAYLHQFTNVGGIVLPGAANLLASP
jgi:hypothetical protein